MSAVLWKTRVPRLATLIDTPGGISVGQALEQARQSLGTLRDQSDALIEANIDALLALTAPVSLDDQTTRLLEAYDIARAIIDAASPFGRDDLCRSATGLCNLIDGNPPRSAFDWRIVTAYAQSLRLMFTLPPDAEDQRSAILRHLDQVVAHKGATPPAA